MYFASDCSASHSELRYISILSNVQNTILCLIITHGTSARLYTLATTVILARWLRQVITFSAVRLCGIVLAPSAVHFVDVFSCFDKETHSGTVCYTSSLLDMLVFVLLNRGYKVYSDPLEPWSVSISELFYSFTSCFQGSARIWALNACCTLTVKMWIQFFSVTWSNDMDCLTGTPCTRLLISKIRQRCLSDISHSFCNDKNK